MYKTLSLFLVGSLCLAPVAAGCSDDTGTGNKDSAVTKKDMTVKPDEQVIQLDQGAYTGPNSASLCKKDADCKHNQERCLFYKGSSNGMCIMDCSPGTNCPKPVPGPYASDCAFSYTNSGGTTSYACGWYCEYQGVTYNCPNATDYQCVAPNSSEPHVKFCVPK